MEATTDASWLAVASSSVLAAGMEWAESLVERFRFVGGKNESNGLQEAAARFLSPALRSGRPIWLPGFSHIDTKLLTFNNSTRRD